MENVCRFGSEAQFPSLQMWDMASEAFVWDQSSERMLDLISESKPVLGSSRDLPRSFLHPNHGESRTSKQ